MPSSVIPWVAERTKDQVILSLAPPRAKIEALVRKGGEPDEDAPSDPASVRYWTRVAGTMSERDRTVQSLETSMSVEADASGSLADAMMGGDDEPSRETALAGRGTEEALELLSGLSNNAATANPKGASANYEAFSLTRRLDCHLANPVPVYPGKAKAKAKGKGKKATLQAPKTLTELQDETRTPEC